MLEFDIYIEPAPEVQLEVIPEVTEVTIEVLSVVPGDAAQSTSIEIVATAGETISGGKAVIIGTDGKAYVMDITNENHYGATSGIAKAAAEVNEPVTIIVEGVVNEVGSGWQPGRLYYVNAIGLLTTTPPTSGIVKLIGLGIGTDKIILKQTLELITI